MDMSTSPSFEPALHAVWRRSDELFALIPDTAFLERPIGLRHPFVFYLGHLPAFAWNQVGRGALEAGHLDASLDILFERGIDPDSEQAARDRTISAWPSIPEVLGYRDEVRREVLQKLPAVLERKDDILCEHGRVLHLVLEHEIMHHETLLYMVAACRPGLIQRPSSLPGPQGGPGRAAEFLTIPEGSAEVGADWNGIPFGWDNEFSRITVQVPAFRIGSLPVRNRDWLEFYRAKGEPSALFPQNWERRGSAWAVKTVFGPVSFDLAEGWPVQVTGDQARAYCAFHGGRLPTEAELQRAAYGSPENAPRIYPWGDAEPTAEHGNFGFRHWSPVPTGLSPKGKSAWGVEELLGNGWEWTQTPFAPLPGFRAWARTYPGYSADFFDGEHDIVFGASWATDEKLLRPSFRNWYRRNYPYPFTSFRVVKDVG